ncbi:UNVERIFIED_CONTAM: hypothetical protein Slati_2646900 [Sesamum latifolium]|uniref:Uncharacterized protein n=1 Tax=Sesamum latifolium TaxID=2727402 RepID=A0AAW2VXJ5_9LAMI
MKNTIHNAFIPIRGLDIRLIEEGRILFKFEHVLDRKRVMDGGPRSFEKILLVLKAIEEDDNPAQTDWVDFFVHIDDLPLGRRTKDMAEFIESLISFTYERLPNFCYWCGQLRHIIKFCECQLEPGFDENQNPLSFGPWLPATLPLGLRSRGGTPFEPRPTFILDTRHKPPSPAEPRQGTDIFGNSSAANQNSSSFLYILHLSYTKLTYLISPTT